MIHKNLDASTLRGCCGTCSFLVRLLNIQINFTTQLESEHKDSIEESNDRSDMLTRPWSFLSQLIYQHTTLTDMLFHLHTRQHHTAMQKGSIARHKRAKLMHLESLYFLNTEASLHRLAALLLYSSLIFSSLSHWPNNTNPCSACSNVMFGRSSVLVTSASFWLFVLLSRA